MNIVELPVKDITDIPRGLRALADSIEAGTYDDAHNLAWVIDCGSGRIELGLLGQTAEPGAIGHFLFALAQRRLETAGVSE